MRIDTAYARAAARLAAHATAKGSAWAFEAAIQSAATPEDLRTRFEGQFATRAWVLLCELPGGLVVDQVDDLGTLWLEVAAWLVENPALSRAGGGAGTVLTEASDLLDWLFGHGASDGAPTAGRNLFSLAPKPFVFDGSPHGLLFHRFNFRIRAFVGA